MVTCFCWVSSVFFAVSFAAWSEALELDLNLTRQEIITFLGQPANLGCHATTTLINSSLSYSWTKDNQTVTQSPRVKAFGDVLVVTPEGAADFGTYQCNITNGVSSILCRVSLLQGLDKPDDSKTGCVNVSVLMPVLAVAVLSLLLFIHLLLQSRRRRRRNDTFRSKRSDEISLQNQEQTRVHDANVVNEEHQLQPIELPANGRVRRMSGDEVVEENQVTQF
ncbi:uncharacterized protein LOC110053900 [Orbicella faveolata]|uniref:uncharacterized protein LOC110053900 n=1 Tax=Orbicella faveolata TaxID=48498 RepID=UPI0009E3C44B|nr:uncharacterized protein LOC110053900 [Orbicella faveolata]